MQHVLRRRVVMDKEEEAGLRQGIANYMALSPQIEGRISLHLAKVFNMPEDRIRAALGDED